MSQEKRRLTRRELREMVENPEEVARRLLRKRERQFKLSYWIIRGLNLFTLGFLSFIMYQVFKPQVFNFKNIGITLQLIILMILVLILLIVTLPGLLLYVISPYYGALYIYTIRSYILNFMFSGIKVPGFLDENVFLGSSTELFGPFAYLLDKPQQILYQDILLYATALTFYLLMILAGLMFIYRSNIRSAGTVFVLAQSLIALGYFKDLLAVPLTLDASTVGSMLGSPLFYVGLVSYFYFEFALQTSYVSVLFNPTLERQRKVTKAIQFLQRYKLGGQAEKERAMKTQDKTGDTEQEGEEKKGSAQLSISSSGSTLAKKYGAAALIYFLEQASDSLFARPGGEREKLTGRLQRYHDGLLRYDPETDVKLSGASQELNPFKVMLWVSLSMALRLTLLIFFSWLMLTPNSFLASISYPKDAVNSIELTQPEGIILVLLPIAMLFIVIGWLISYIQARTSKAEQSLLSAEDVEEYLKRKKFMKFEEKQLPGVKKRSSSKTETTQASPSQSASSSRKKKPKRVKPKK